MPLIGTGVPAYGFGRAEGVLAHFRSPTDVIAAIDGDLESTIALVESGGTTFLSPILGRLAGVVCRSGTLRSHLAIVSREFELPCILGTELPGDLRDGDRVVLEAVDGVGLIRSPGADDRPVGAPPTDAARSAGAVAPGSRPAPAQGGAVAAGVAAPGAPETGAPETRAPVADAAVADAAVPGGAGSGGAVPGGAGSGAAVAGGEPVDLVARWWGYVRRVGDEAGVKPFDLTVDAKGLDRLIAEPLDDTRLNDLVEHMGRAFKPEITRRSGFTSELFPMLPYMTLSVIEDFHSYPARVAAVDAAMPAEEIGRRLRDAPGLVSPLWIWMVGYHYLTGRECLIRMGRLRRDERTDEVRTVVDFWRRLTLAHRGDGTLDYKDAGFTDRYLPTDVVADLVAGGSTLTEDSARVLRRLNATVSGYAFLYFCESRVGVCDSGPYPLADGRQVIVRDFLSLGPSEWDYPWARDLAPPYPGLTLALTYDPAAFTSLEINDWGTTFTEPGQLLPAVGEAAVYGLAADGTRRRLDVADQEAVTVALGRDHVRLYQRFMAMDRRERIMAATRMYTAGLRPFAAVAGATDVVDWRLHPDTLALYPDPLDDDDRAAGIFGGAVVANDLAGSFSPIT